MKAQKLNELILSTNDGIFNFDLELTDLEQLSELFYSNISFLKEHKENTRKEILKNRDLKKFLDH